VNFSSSLKAVLVCGSAGVLLTPTAMAQAPTENEIAYKEVLQAISDTETSISHKQVFIAKQQEEIKSLQGQINGLDDVKATIPAMVEKMTAAIENEINADFPFQMDQRRNRLASLQKMVANPEAKLAEKYRKALDVYKIEVNYGQSLESYQGNHPVTPTIRQGDERYEKDENGEVLLDEKTFLPVEIFDGNYLRYGRTAFVYLNKDGSGPMRYDLNYEPTAEDLEKCQNNVERCKWRSIPNGKAVEIRRAIRVSRGEVAPTVVAAPISPMP